MTVFGRSRVWIEGVARWEELPVIRAVRQRQLEDAVIDAPDLAIAYLGDFGDVERVVTASSRAHHELADAAGGIGRAVRRLRGEALVVVLVAGQNHVRASVVQHLPERLHPGVVPVLDPRAEPRVVPHGEGTRSWMRGEVVAEPRQLVL